LFASSAKDFNLGWDDLNFGRTTVSFLRNYAKFLWQSPIAA